MRLDWMRESWMLLTTPLMRSSSEFCVFGHTVVGGSEWVIIIILCDQQKQRGKNS